MYATKNKIEHTSWACCIQLKKRKFNQAVPNFSWHLFFFHFLSSSWGFKIWNELVSSFRPLWREYPLTCSQASQPDSTAAAAAAAAADPVQLAAKSFKKIGEGRRSRSKKATRKQRGLPVPACLACEFVGLFSHELFNGIESIARLKY